MVSEDIILLCHIEKYEKLKSMKKTEAYLQKGGRDKKAYNPNANHIISLLHLEFHPPICFIEGGLLKPRERD